MLNIARIKYVSWVSMYSGTLDLSLSKMGEKGLLGGDDVGEGMVLERGWSRAMGMEIQEAKMRCCRKRGANEPILY